MSNRLSSKNFAIESHALRAWLLTKPYTVNGHALSRADSVRIGHSYYYWFLMMRDILQLAEMPGLGRQCSDMNLLHYVETVAAFDAGYVQDQLKNVLLLLRRIPHNGMTYKAFRKALQDFGVEVGEVIGNSYDPIYPHIKRIMMRDVPKGCFTAINTIVQFMTRLTLQDVDWIVEEEAQKYLQLEEELHTQTYPLHTCYQLRGIVEEWFSDFSFENAKDHHGYGATFDVKRSAGTYCKYLSIINSQSEQIWPVIQMLGVPSHFRVKERALDAYLLNLEGKLDESRLACNRLVKCSFVPKGINKKRLISMEDTSNQFYQKILAGLIDRHFRTHPEIRVDLHDQTLSQEDARLGSVTLKTGTFDLSSASDSVTWSLVQCLFERTSLWPIIKKIRTPKALLEFGDTSTIVDLEKAFPMGSALCFPIECIIFSAILTLAARRLGIHSYNYRVYGDDMTVPSYLAAEVEHILKELHFKLNTDKSYFPGSRFTEACGGEYVDGVDVSPLRLSRKLDIVSWYVDSTKTQQLETLRDLHNQALDYGCVTLAKAICEDARKHISNLYFVFNSEDEWKTYNYPPANQNCKIRYRRPCSCKLDTKYPIPLWQGQLEYKSIKPRSKFTRPPGGEHLRLERWFETKEEEYAKVMELIDIENLTPHAILLARLMLHDSESPQVGSAKVSNRYEWLPHLW